MNRNFAVIDVGPRGVSAVLAHWEKTGDYSIDGFIRKREEGFNRGSITDISRATDAIAGTLNELRKETGKKFQNVYASISSSSIAINKTSGVLLLSKYGREINESDIKKCVQIASTVKVPIDKELLHSIITSFSVDGEREIKNPLKLEGVKLMASVNVLMIDHSTVKNMEKCISHAGYMPAGFVFSGLASAYRVLTEKEGEDTVLFLNIDKNTTEMMLFSKGVLENCKVLSYGAQELILKSPDLNQKICQKLVNTIRALELWQYVNRVIVVGEGAFSNELLSFLDQSLKVSIRHGNCRIRPLEEIPHQHEEYICALGMLDYIQEERIRNKAHQNFILKTLRRLTNFLDRYF